MLRVPRAASSIADFLARSRGVWIASDSFLYFHATSGLTGYFLWADPSAEELDALTSIIAESLRLEPHPSLVDGREFRTPPLRYYERMARFFEANAAELTRSVERLALIRPGGIAGVAAGGFFSLVKSPYPVSLFETLEPALEWLGQTDAAPLASELEELRSATRAIDPLLHRVRADIEQALPQPNVNVIAKRMGMSERTLHRRLHALGSTFGDEVARARVALAKRLLRETNSPVTRIALEIGCPSVSTFSVLFRKWTGMSPTTYRDTPAT